MILNYLLLEKRIYNVRKSNISNDSLIIPQKYNFYKFLQRNIREETRKHIHSCIELKD